MHQINLKIKIHRADENENHEFVVEARVQRRRALAAGLQRTYRAKSGDPGELNLEGSLDLRFWDSHGVG